MFSFVVSIYFFSKTERLSWCFDLWVLPSKSFLPFSFKPKGKSFFFFFRSHSVFLNPTSGEKNFDFETKVWDKMPTERETYYLCYLKAFIDLKQTNLWRWFRADKCVEVIRCCFNVHKISQKTSSHVVSARNAFFKTGFAQKKGGGTSSAEIHCKWFFFFHIFSHGLHQSATL